MQLFVIALGNITHNIKFDSPFRDKYFPSSSFFIKPNLKQIGDPIYSFATIPNKNTARIEIYKTLCVNIKNEKRRIRGICTAPNTRCQILVTKEDGSILGQYNTIWAGDNQKYVIPNFSPKFSLPVCVLTMNENGRCFIPTEEGEQFDGSHIPQGIYKIELLVMYGDGETDGSTTISVGDSYKIPDDFESHFNK